MATRGTFLDEHLEKILFAGALLALIAYFAMHWQKDDVNPSEDWGDQKYQGDLRSNEVTGAVEFGDANLRTYLPGSQRIIWVQPLEKKVYTAVKLELPTPQVTPPPVPLPRPGPAFGYSSSFDRMQPGSRVGAEANGDGEGEEP